MAAALPGVARGQTVFVEAFDTVVAPALPTGWVAGDGWATSESSASTGSGLNNLAHTGMGVSEVSLPSVSLAGVSGATLSFLARRTSSYPLEAMQVTASLDGGTTWPVVIMAAGSALPSAASAWESIDAPVPGTLLGQTDVLIRFEVSGGASSGANLRLDDVLVESTGGGSTGGGSSLGFSGGSSAAPSPMAGFSVGVLLDLNEVENLGALQLSVTWDSDVLSWSGVVPGVDLSDTSLWTLSAEAGANEATVLVVSPVAASLPAGRYEPIMELVFDVGPLPDGIPQDVSLTISNVIGALAVPTGDDAGIALSASVHLVSVTAATPDFQAPASLDLGITAFGETSFGTLTVSNAGGFRDLVISSAIADNPVFGVSPSSATVTAGGTFDFAVTYTPDGTALGAQFATVQFTHDGANGPVSLVSLAGQAGAGKGDANGDARVDLLDFLISIDVALGRVNGAGGVLESVDLYPFELADGSVDVRDLTVLAHAISRDAWPDGEPLPDPANGTLAGKAGDGSGGNVVFLSLVESGMGLEVWVRSTTSLRGLQLDLHLSGTVDEVLDGTASEKAPLFVGSTPTRIRFLWARLDGGLIPKGEALLAVLRPVSPDAVTLGRSIVVSSQETVTAVALGPDPAIPDAPDFELGAPYPNPFSASGPDNLQIPIAAAQGPLEVRIVDILGRELQRIERAASGQGAVTTLIWPGTDRHGNRVAPGIYFLRGSGSGGSEVRSIVVTR